MSWDHLVLDQLGQNMWVLFILGHLLVRQLKPLPQPYALALALLSIFAIFIVELIAFRWGTAKLTALNMTHGMLKSFPLRECNNSSVTDPHGHNATGSHAAHGPEVNGERAAERIEEESFSEKRKVDDLETLHNHGGMDHNAAAQIIGVFILEFGVVLHRYILSCRKHLLD